MTGATVHTRSFHDSKTTLVVVNEYGNPSIGTKLGVPLLLLNVLHDADALEYIIRSSICSFDLFKDDTGFVSIGRPEGQQLQALVGDESAWSRHGRWWGLGDNFWYYFDKVLRSLEESLNRSLEHEKNKDNGKNSVSYTHLTLPTKRIV